MRGSEKRWGKRILWSAISLVVAVALLCGVCLAFLLDCYEADQAAIDAFSVADSIDVHTVNNAVIYAPDNATVGIVFYPGAKVEYTAYLPLMEACASKGILCVLVEMPLYFPLIDPEAAAGIPERYHQIDNWYIGGHSLGGYAASSYLADNLDIFDGLILLASYTASDLSATDLSVLSIYGSEDQIMNRERYAEGLSKLPADYTEVVIDGGCHAYFGMYKGQDGSVDFAVTNEEQLLITADAIANFVSGK